jgi:hypothetical protein
VCNAENSQGLQSLEFRFYGNGGSTHAVLNGESYTVSPGDTLVVDVTGDTTLTANVGDVSIVIDVGCVTTPLYVDDQFDFANGDSLTVVDFVTDRGRSASFCPAPVEPITGQYDDACQDSDDLGLCQLECPADTATQDAGDNHYGVFDGMFLATTFEVAQCMDGNWQSPDYLDPIVDERLVASAAAYPRVPFSESWEGKLPHCEYAYGTCDTIPPYDVPDQASGRRPDVPDQASATPRHCEICSPENMQHVTALVFSWISEQPQASALKFSFPGGQLSTQAVNGDQVSINFVSTATPAPTYAPHDHHGHHPHSAYHSASAHFPYRRSSDRLSPRNLLDRLQTARRQPR